jgi:hypothetical protein
LETGVGLEPTFATRQVLMRHLSIRYSIPHKTWHQGNLLASSLHTPDINLVTVEGVEPSTSPLNAERSKPMSYTIINFWSHWTVVNLTSPT